MNEELKKTLEAVHFRATPEKGVMRVVAEGVDFRAYSHWLLPSKFILSYRYSSPRTVAYSEIELATTITAQQLAGEILRVIKDVTDTPRPNTSTEPPNAAINHPVLDAESDGQQILKF